MLNSLTMLPRLRVWLPVLFAACLSMTSFAADKGEWTNISDTVIAQVPKIGYPGKHTAGVAVDPASGDIYMVISDNGIWKSTDQGEKFERVDGMAIGGRCETGFALNFDPAGKRLACFMIYGSCGSTSDGGKTWEKWKTNHLDYGAVDWNDTGKCFLSIRHEKNGTLTMSTDAGQTWTDLGEKFLRVGLLDSKTLICTNDKGIVRSEDGGKTWETVSDAKPSAFVMTAHNGVGYWGTEKGLLVSRDKGKTWKIEGAAIPVVHGPQWGKDAKHMLIINKDGFQESKDGGETWKKAAALPDGYGVGGVGPNYGWDPVHDIFYASSMGKPTLRFKR